MRIVNINKVAKGQRLGARYLNRSAKKIEQANNISVGGNISMSQSPIGMVSRSRRVIGEVFHWFELTANLDAGGSATAKPLAWTPGDGGSFEEDTDLGASLTVTDKVGQFWGIIGEKLMCRRYSSSVGTLWIPYSSGAPWHRATLDSALAVGDSTTATTSGGVSVTVYDEFLDSGSLNTGAVVGIEYDVEQARWAVVNAKCN